MFSKGYKVELKNHVSYHTNFKKLFISNEGFKRLNKYMFVCGKLNYSDILTKMNKIMID